jgi:fucose 4-O-acetylase-like acetyltransferase
VHFGWRRGTMTRSSYLDNAKALLIALVVFGHLIESALTNASTIALYKTIYSFHMPAFILIAGYLSHADRFGRKWAEDLLGIALVFVVTQALYAAADAINGKFLGWDYYSQYPRWVLWYLLSLLGWKAALPLFRYGAFSIMAAIAISLASGFIAYDPLAYSWQRTAAFLPFFVLGHALQTKADLYGTVPRWARIAAAGAFASTFAFFLVYGTDVQTSWLYGRQLYDENFTLIIRLGLLVLAGLLIVSAAVLVPSRRMSLSYLGSRTLSVFVLHGVLVLCLRETSLQIALADTVICALAAIGIVWTLSRDIFATPFTWLWSAPRRLIAAIPWASAGLTTPRRDG